MAKSIKDILKEYNRGIIPGLVSGIVVAILMTIINGGCRWSNPKCWPIFIKFFFYYFVFFGLGLVIMIWIEKEHASNSKKNPKKIHQIKEEKRYLKVIILVIFGIILFAGYWRFTDYIQENKIYPLGEDWFYYDIFQGYAPNECFHIEPNYLVFDNKRGVFSVYTNFRKKCDFTYSITWLSVSDMDYYQIDNEKNLTISKFRNMSKPDRLRIIINSSDMELNEYYTMRFYFKLKKDFYNYFSLTASDSTIEQFRISYRNDLKGYLCEPNCFDILEGNVSREESVWRGISKTFRFGNENYILITSSPKSKYWFFWQKIADTIILGIIVIILYEMFNILILRNKR